jgi:predicted enzyme related to lactoylglutathione lyase
MADNSSRGRFVWHDLMTSDPKGAEAFYPRAVNWGTQPWEELAYTMWTANGQPLGGVMDLPTEAGAPPHWLAYVSVPDVDGASSLAESLGGKVLKPGADIPKVGRFAILRDPHGAVFAVFTSADPTPRPDTEPALGEFSWHELAAKDYKQAFSFYEALFGWERSAEHDMGPLGTYFIFKRNGRDLGGMFNVTPDMPMPPSWMHYIRVDSADAAADRVTSNGGQVLNGPMEVPGGDRVAQCLDPQGAAFAVHSKAT